MRPRKEVSRGVKSPAPFKVSAWNSLEVTKIVVAMLTPLMVAFVGFLIQSEIADQARQVRASERLVDRRLVVYDEIRTGLNRIYCFIDDVGTWKEETPDTISMYRRKIHAVMHTNRAIWPEDTFNEYLLYMDQVAFKTFQGVGQDAEIRTFKYQKEFGIPGWRAEWNERLTDEKDSSHSEVYIKLLKLMSRDLQLSIPVKAAAGGYIEGNVVFDLDPVSGD
jgi:hypothetical protein